MVSPAAIAGRRSRLILPPSAGGPYILAFPNTENPLSDGGKWTQGLDVGQVFNNVRCIGGSPGIAIGTVASSNGPPILYDDNVAVAKTLGFSTTRFYTRYRIYKPPGYTPSAAHEIEMLSAFDIGDGFNRGYELSIGYGNGIQPIRQNGDAGDYTVGIFDTLSGASFGVAHDDFVDVLFDSSSGSPVITLLLNDDEEEWVITDVTAGKITSGYGGMGMFGRPHASLDFTKYGFSYFEYGNI